MSEVKCKGCNGAFDVGEMEPFTAFECAECGQELIVPGQFDFLTLNNYLGNHGCFDIYSCVDNQTGQDGVVSICAEEVSAFIASRNKATLAVLEKGVSEDVAKVLKSGFIEGMFYVIEEACDGYCLAQYDPLVEGELSVNKVLEVIKRVGMALGKLHNSRIIHHNICPANIHINSKSEVKLKHTFISSATYDGEVAAQAPITASPYFISPEKAEYGEENQLGDVFSLAATTYYMLTGQRPFDGESAEEIVAARLISSSNYKKPDSLIKLRSDLPEEIALMIMRGMSYEPEKRVKLPALIDSIQAFQAEKEKAKDIMAAQKRMVLTDTIGIPKTFIRKNEKRGKFAKFFS